MATKRIVKKTETTINFTHLPTFSSTYQNPITPKRPPSCLKRRLLFLPSPTQSTHQTTTAFEKTPFFENKNKTQAI